MSGDYLLGDEQYKIERGERVETEAGSEKGSRISRLLLNVATRLWLLATCGISRRSSWLVSTVEHLESMIKHPLFGDCDNTDGAIPAELSCMQGGLAHGYCAARPDAKFRSSYFRFPVLLGAVGIVLHLRSSSLQDMKPSF